MSFTDVVKETTHTAGVAQREFFVAVTGTPLFDCSPQCLHLPVLVCGSGQGEDRHIVQHCRSRHNLLDDGLPHEQGAESPDRHSDRAFQLEIGTDGSTLQPVTTQAPLSIQHRRLRDWKEMLIQQDDSVLLIRLCVRALVLVG